MRSTPPFALACLFALLIGWVGLLARGTVAAQELPAPPRRGSPTMHRTRAIAAWKRYVWSLERPLLAQVITDLEAELVKTEGRIDFTPELLLAHAHLMLGRPERALESLLRAEKIAPDHAGLVLVSALIAISERSEDSIAILDHYLRRLEAEPLDPAFGHELRFLGLVHRGIQHMARGHFDAAAADLEAARQICDEVERDAPAPLVQRLARAHQALGEFARAEELIREMLERDPRDALNYLNMGVLFYEQDRFDEARRWYEAAVDHDPTSAEPQLRLAYLASAAGDLPRLRRHLDIFERLSTARAGGEQLDPDTQVEIDAAYGGYWFARAGRLRARGAERETESAYALARERLDAALRTQPHCLRALTLRVQVAAQTGEDPARLAELRALLDAVQSDDDDAPSAHRGVFC